MKRAYLKRLIVRLQRSPSMIRMLARQPDVVEEVVMALPEPTTEELIAQIIDRYHKHDVDAQVWLNELIENKNAALCRRA